MKMRVFQNMDDAVFRVTIFTQDWSEGDVELMVQYGEPEVNVGGDIHYVCGGIAVKPDGAKSVNYDQCTKSFGDEFVRVLHGFPYSRGFDSRDYDSIEEARAVGVAWKEAVLNRIASAVLALRENSAQLPTEEVTEI